MRSPAHQPCAQQPAPSILRTKAFGVLAPRQPLAQEARGPFPALAGHALGTAAGRPWRLLCHSAPSHKPRALTLLSGHGRKQPYSPETTPVSRPLSAPELTSMRPRSQEHQELDLAGHNPFSWGVKFWQPQPAGKPSFEMDGANRAPRQ